MWTDKYSSQSSLCYGITCLVSHITLLPLVVLVYLLVVLICPLVVLVCPFVILVCPLVLYVCLLVVLVVLSVNSNTQNVLARSFKLEERYNWNYTCCIHSKAFSHEVSNWKKDAIKIISINRKIETQLQQIGALRCSSSILAVTGKSGFQFSKFYSINRALEPKIPGSEYAEMIWINKSKFQVVLYPYCTRVVSCCLVLYLPCLMLCRVELVLPCVVSCCFVVYRVVTRVVF